MHNTIRVHGLLALVLAVVPSLGCDEKKPAPAPAPTQTAVALATAPVATATAASTASSSPESDAGNSAYMLNCPTAAPGAKTVIKDVPEGVEVTVTGDEAASVEIRERVKKLVASAASEGSGQHNRGGGGRGRSGHCTIITRNTTVEAADVPGGSKLTVKAKAKAEVDWLRRETKDRDQTARAPGGENMGKNHLSHCPSAVEGAATKVAENKEGVVLTVTATKPESVKVIRERAAHQVEISKKPEPKSPEHNNEGGGGGALGRCPVVLQGDTAVTAKDIEGGSEITVKSKKAADVAALVKETKDRAATLAKTK